MKKKVSHNMKNYGDNDNMKKTISKNFKINNNNN